MAYYPPCHRREQNLWTPYVELLRLVPQICLGTIGGALFCCGMAGIMGFKQDFHQGSVTMGSRLMERIKRPVEEMAPVVLQGSIMKTK
jgi:glycerol-3-phosphate dehydrogenase subunit C